MSIILVGYMGSGKTTIGKKLAKRLHYNFIDLDDYIVQKEQRSINKIFKEKGEIYFRKLESKSLEELIMAEEDFVLSVGGGTPCYGNNMNIITSTPHSIYLKASLQTLYDRLVHQKNERPLIKEIAASDLKEFIAKHLFERSLYYEKAKTIITVENKNITEIVEAVMLSMQ